MQKHRRSQLRAKPCGTAARGEVLAPGVCRGLALPAGSATDPRTLVTNPGSDVLLDQKTMSSQASQVCSAMLSSPVPGPGPACDFVPQCERWREATPPNAPLATAGRASCSAMSSTLGILRSSSLGHSGGCVSGISWWFRLASPS